jgi:peptidoglycan/xylan/chitin deacetylase (PgdA/CDA1 family)
VVGITFDDGYLDTATTAAPILEHFGFPATVFVVTDNVGEIASWDDAFGGEAAPLATWEQLRALRARGWEIGVHTRTHANLTRLPAQAVLAEFVAGKATLERVLGEPICSAAYPFGAYTPDVAAAAERAGLRVAVTMDGGIATQRANRYAMPRLAIMRGDTLLDFVLVLMTGRSVRAWIGVARRAARQRWRQHAAPPREPRSSESKRGTR